MPTPHRVDPVNAMGTTQQPGVVGGALGNNNTYQSGVANGKGSDQIRTSAETHEYHYDDALHTEEQDQDRIHGYSIRSQLEGWHANRGNKSVARAMVPPWCPPKDEPTILNPFKLVKNMTALQWLMFLCGWFCWTCDGHVSRSRRC